MEQNTCYLAGPIRGLPFNQADLWRQSAEAYLGEHHVRCLSPLRFKRELLPANVPLTENYEHPHPLIIPKGVVARDLRDVYMADALLVYLRGAKEISIGTVLEIGAAYAQEGHKPIVLVIEPGNIHNHIMLNEMCGFVTDNLDEGCSIIAAVLGR